MFQLISFFVGEHLFGLDVQDIKEVNQLVQVAGVPRTPSYIRGLVNLRGKVVTVVDLGACLGMGERMVTGRSHNIVLQKGGVGLLVDGIGDVLTIADSDLDSKSTFLLLQILGDLQAGTTPSAGPVLTLPVAR